MLLRDSLPVTLAVTVSRSEAQRREEAVLSHYRGKWLSQSLQLHSGGVLFPTSPSPAGKSGHVVLENNEGQ